jgi:malonyl-CoA/methylmalonyl-CoA synthetase
MDMLSSSRGPALFRQAAQHSARCAIHSEEEGDFTYQQLLEASGSVASSLKAGIQDLQEARVAYLAPAGFQHVAIQWGIWRAGGVAVPLCPQHSASELSYVLRDAEVSVLVVHPEYEAKADTLARPRNGLVRLSSTALLAGQPGRLPNLDPARRALILFTSGTTNRPKGVVLTHANIQVQVESLIKAWEWTAEDAILHVLPLHHVHGIINVLTCALWAGARCDMHRGFDAERVWKRFEEGGLTLFMAVPTIYSKLITHWKAAPEARRTHMSRACQGIRLMVSGSAALPVPILEEWQRISGHVLLERYGMTEIGMALSNPLRGKRVPGCVGQPLPSVEVRLVDDDSRPAPPGTPGEIEARGPGVFLEYWRKPEETIAAFRDGWFRTGDVAVLEDGRYRILGRKSLDIIKTGGYKVSALEVEDVLLRHPDVRECAVVGIPEAEWGEIVSAALVVSPGSKVTAEEIKAWSLRYLAGYKSPRRILKLDSLPRNAMGKVQKTEVTKYFMDRRGL